MYKRQPQNPKVAVCIPAYGQPALLRQALASVQQQVGVAVELIVSDDSPDAAAAAVVQEFAAEMPLQYVRNPVPLGSPANWNAALRRATAPLVLLLHHDDRLTAPHALHTLVTQLEASPQAAFAAAATRMVRLDTGRVLRVNRLTAEKKAELEAEPERLLAGNLVGVPSTVLFRRSDELLFDENLKWLVDVDFYVRLLKIRKLIVFVEEVLLEVGSSDTQVTAAVTRDAPLLLREHFYFARKFSIDLSREPYFTFFGKLLARLHATTPAALGRAGVEALPPPALLARWAAQAAAYRRRGRFERAVIWLKYRFLGLKKKDLQ